MKKMKKLFAILMTMAMVMGLGITGFATETTYEDGIRVYGVEAEEGITVKAYQIIKYNQKGYYEPVIPESIEEDENGNLTPSAANILALSQSLDDLTTSVKLTLETSGTGDSYYKATTATDLTPGSWMIIVTGSDDYIYNPAIVSVNQTTDGIEYGELNLDTDSWGKDVWLKKSEPTIEKTALTPSVTGVQYGDIIQFQIESTIPSYASNKENITFTITDTLDGLALVVDDDHPVRATLAGTNDSTLTELVSAAFTNEKTNDVVVALNDENFSRDTYIKNHGNEKIVITYYAKVTKDAKVTVNKLTNTAKLDYSKETGTSNKSEETKHYTFGIDTTFSGSTTTTNKTGEFIKIDDEGNVAYTENPGEVIVTEGKALVGAVFELHIGSAEGALFTDVDGEKQFTTDNTGRLEIVGLDSDVTYYLVEVKAPTGYTLNETPIPVKINATYDEDETLTGYSVVIGEGNNQATTNYNYRDQDGTTTVAEEVGNPYGFKNTTLTALPSTGGMGTTLFTIAGCVIMISAAGLFFATRKKAN